MNCRNCHEAIKVNKSGKLVHEATGSIYCQNSGKKAER